MHRDGLFVMCASGQLVSLSSQLYSVRVYMCVCAFSHTWNCLFPITLLHGSFFLCFSQAVGVFVFCVCHKLSRLKCVFVEKVQLRHFYSPPLFSPTLRALVSSEGPCKCLCVCAKFVRVCLPAFVFMRGEITFPYQW